jgi:hypothetical protein
MSRKTQAARPVWRAYFASAQSLRISEPEPSLVTRLRTALVHRGAPMKAFELGRVLSASPDLVHRTLRQHPRVFARVQAADHVDCWILRVEGQL